MSTEMSASDQSRGLSVSTGGFGSSYADALAVLERARFSERIWSKDAGLWKSAPEIREKIRNRLGWLTVAGDMAKEVEPLSAFARQVRASGIDHVVLLGMGGSSLCPEVMRLTFGVRPGWPDLAVLDSTDPATIRRAEKRIDPARALYILASKSGSTIEVQSLYRYFHEKASKRLGTACRNQFVVITDPGTPLEDLARTEKFRKVFLNPADIGGRYSALSYFGLVPASLIGLDLPAFLHRALKMVNRCGPEVPAADHPGLSLGAAIGGLGKVGVDKMTFITSPSVGRFGLWAEQLVAESTGKEGKGIVPVEGERPGEPRSYGEDRLFVYLRAGETREDGLDDKVAELERAGYPVVRILLSGPMDLGAEFFRWEMATAAAGCVLGINPFDEPNVSESKSNTSRALDQFGRDGTLGLPDPVAREDGLAVCGNVAGGKGGTVKEVIDRFLVQAGTNDYVALMAYIEQNDAHEALLQEIRHKIRDRFRIATTLGYGPRFLHSTGQLHKGGAGNGLFIQITAEEPEDLPIPGGIYGFGILKRAQALGDFLSLQGKGLRVIEIRLGRNADEDLRTLARLFRLT